MIGLDTNVVVRYIVQDDPLQSPQATRLIESLSAESPGFITMVSVIELVWVLQGCYRATRAELVEVLETLLRTRELVVERAEAVLRALRVFAHSNADFADCLIERCARDAGCDDVMTFDRDAAKTAGMRVIN
jgi:predicted nucleic-acid-binding protein